MQGIDTRLFRQSDVFKNACREALHVARYVNRGYTAEQHETFRGRFRIASAKFAHHRLGRKKLVSSTMVLPPVLRQKLVGGDDGLPFILAAEILQPSSGTSLLLVDAEHFLLNFSKTFKSEPASTCLFRFPTSLVTADAGKQFPKTNSRAAGRALQPLNIRYAQMTMALIAQAVIHQLRQRLGQPFSAWDADHLSRELFSRLDGDVRVTDDTIIVTHYNAPNADLLRRHYAGLPDQLTACGVPSQVPRLYGYRLDFRFR